MTENRYHVECGVMRFGPKEDLLQFQSCRCIVCGPSFSFNMIRDDITGLIVSLILSRQACGRKLLIEGVENREILRASDTTTSPFVELVTLTG